MDLPPHFGARLPAECGKLRKAGTVGTERIDQPYLDQTSTCSNHTRSVMGRISEVAERRTESCTYPVERGGGGCGPIMVVPPVLGRGCSK